MNVAVLSGKGGTGKTFVSVNLASSLSKAVYLDCDVEEPNGYLFFKPSVTDREPVKKMLPVFDKQKCNGCRKCVDFCRFNALAYIKDCPKVFDEVCHSCTGCSVVCPENAVSYEGREIGRIECGEHRDVSVVTGFLNVGEASGVNVIKGVLKHMSQYKRISTIIDCPPGCACSAMESINKADYCIIVAEPTAFGIHNFKMVHELVTLMNKPVGVVINKAPYERTAIEDMCDIEGISVIGRIHYRQDLALINARGEIAAEADGNIKILFKDMWHRITEEVKG